MINQTLFKQRFQLTYNNLKAIRHWLKNQSQKINLNENITQNLILVCNEYCANLLDHQSPKASIVELKYGLQDNYPQFQISDNGAFWADMTHRIKTATLPNEPVCRKLGLALINTYFPQFHYYQHNQRNIIQFTLPFIELKPQLLIVDDSPSQLALFASFLRDHYQLILFSRPSEALQWLAHNRCDMVITDLHMPGMDGFTFRDKVTEHNGCQSIPFIFISSDNKDTTLLEAARASIDDYINKPINKEKLLNILKRVLSRHSNLASIFEKQLLAQMTPYQAELPQEITIRDITINIDQYPKSQGDLILYRQAENNEPTLLILGDNMGHGPLAKANGVGWFGYIAGLLDAGINTPDEICKILNKQLLNAQNNKHLICLMIIMIEPNDHLTIYNAGMPTALTINNHKNNYLHENIGLLGINEELIIKTHYLELTQDISVHCYSDGLSDNNLSATFIENLMQYEPHKRHKALWNNPQRSSIDDKTLITIYRTMNS